MADNEIVSKIFSEYEELRNKASNDRQRRIDEVYGKLPRIKEIDEEIYRAGFENMKNIMRSPEKSAEFNKKLKKNINSLQNEKNEILKKNNISSDYDEYKYNCDLCKDTGYTENGSRCVCYKQKLINELYNRSNLGEVLKKQNFGTFSFKYYSKEKIAGHEKSPYENMVMIYGQCKNLCDNFDSAEKGLLFYGSAGLGKTFLSSCIAKELIDNGKTVLYIRASKLFLMYEDYRFGRSYDKKMLDNIYNADLLIIDDLGTEPQNKNNFSFLFDVICDRASANKKIIINTNLSLNEIDKMYSKRFTSRIYEFFIPLKFYGSDIRIQKMVEK